MPGLLNSNSLPPTNSRAIWSKERDEIDDDLLGKFWSELPLQARQELLRIDKQALFEQARKKLYCSRCNGLLLEGFTQIILYGKSLQLEGDRFHLSDRAGMSSKVHIDSEADDIQDPSVHPWGGLAATRDGILTLLDCFINTRSLKALKKVFNSARAREHERELLYPDACGGESRGWSRGNGRENCALHTARLSCDTLVDFWSALGEETRISLLRMKEEDFIERLMYRFDSKRFCRDCRRNVIREFKELKELKRMRRELRCTSWFCVADTAFQYEVSEDTVQADWHESFADTVGKYHHFEWAIGTGEGKSDILEFEDVGMNGKVQVNGLDLGGLSACFITLRAWKLNGRCTELCVKAHALKGQPCVHRRLTIGDGFVTISKGESIRRFFEHAEEAEEEEDDDTLDKDGNEIDGDGSRPQKHAKSPELAREFLLDAATVIFKEQVEKAFREGTARQNAHSIFVSLALKLLEERVHVACKDIITLEKQIKLLEEEEKEKREEEERRERRRAKEREKKLRRKERLKGKGKDREGKHNELNLLYVDLATSANDSHTSVCNDPSATAVDSGDAVSDPGVVVTPDDNDKQSSNVSVDTNDLKSDDRLGHQCHVDEEFSARESNNSFILEQSKSSRRKLRLRKDSLYHDEPDTMFINGGHRPLRERIVKTIINRSSNAKFIEKHQCSMNRVRERYDYQSCGCSQIGDYRLKDTPKPLYRGSKYGGHGCFIPDKGKIFPGNPARDLIHVKQVWEPRSNSSSRNDVANQSEGIDFDKSDGKCSSEIAETPRKADTLSNNGFVEKSNACGDQIISSSSSDNCSSCLSEGDSSSGAQNTTESSSTSDSEDVSPQSEVRVDNTSHKQNIRTNEDAPFMGTSSEIKDAQISDNGGFRFDVPPRKQHTQSLHNQTIHMPVFSYHNQSPVSWQASPNGLMPFHQPSHFVYPANSLWSSDFGMQDNPIRTIATPLLNTQHHSLYPIYNNGIYVPNPDRNEQIKNLRVAEPASHVQNITSKLPSNEQNGSARNASRIRSDESSSFSLFHFGGPLAGPAGFNKEYTAAQADVTCSKVDTTVEEYSLFASGSGARFSFF